VLQDPEKSWADAVRNKMGLEPGREFDELEEPRRTWAYYMLDAVGRGRGVIAALKPHGWHAGIRFLDAGCAYGGYLVAASEAGAAEVVGIDVDADYLKLATELLASYRVEGRLEIGSIDDRTLLDGICGDVGFDVVTCTDVLEHVDDPANTMAALARCLSPGGRLYVTIPNHRNPEWVTSDPHFQIAGITLLPRDPAREVAYAVLPWLPRYSVGHYHPLAWYRRRFTELGLQTWLLNPPAGTHVEVAKRLREQAIRIRDEISPDPNVPGVLAVQIREAVRAWADRLLAEVSLDAPDPGILDEYGVQTWELLVVRG